MIDLHTHTIWSDGELVPAEHIRRAMVSGYKAIAITDHADISNIDLLCQEVVKFATTMNKLQTDIIVLPGVEITHVLPEEIQDLVKYARGHGIQIVAVHGETIMEPVIFTAECGWLPDRADEDKFSSNLTHSLFGITSNEVSEVIKLLSLCNEIIPSRLLLAPAEIENTGIKDVDMLLPDIFKSQIPLNIPNFYGSLEKVKLASEEALKKIASLQEKSLRSKEVLDTWHYFASQWQVFAGQFLTARNISNKYRQELYDFRYNFKLAPVLLNYESIKISNL